MKFISPLKIFMSKVKKFTLNLNQYRNTHFRVLNTCKINYKAIMAPQIALSKKYNKAICLYTVYTDSRRASDVGNICSVHEKFFEDAFVELGKLPDDNYNYIPIVVFRYGGLDKENPRVEIEVVELNEENVDKIKDLFYNIIKEAI